MKILTTAILSALISSSALAGNGTDGVNPTKRIFQKWQKEFVVYPKQSLEENKKGIVYVSFELSEVGTMENLQIAESVSKDLDQKALEIAMKMPTDHLLLDGYEEGKVYMLPVKFSIH